MREYNNLRLKGVKCQFGSTHGLEFLGHQISSEGILPPQYNIDKMLKLKIPSNKAEVMYVLGMFGYYRKFIQDYSTIAAPMTMLTRKKNVFKWEKDQQIAFDSILKLLTSNPILSFPDKQQIHLNSYR